VCLTVSTTAALAQGKGKQTAVGKPAAAAALKTTEFPDGTGTIGVPAGWSIDGSYRGTVGLVGPARQRAHMGMGMPIARPDHPTNNLGIPINGPMAPDGDLVGALKGVLALAKNRLISVRSRPAPSSAPGVPAAYFLYELEAADGKRITALGYFTSIADDDGTLPHWLLFYSVVMAPKESFMKDLPTLMAVWNSWRPNGAKPKPGSDGAMIDEVIKDSTRRRAQTLKEQQEMYDRMNEKFKQVIAGP
jgi:hypothetical protein